MSYFRIILAIIMSFYSSSSLGMESTNFQHSNHYFAPELQKTLTFIMLKNRGQEPFNQNQDVLNIIANNNYVLYCDELLNTKIGEQEQSFEKYWKDKLSSYTDDEKWINTRCGQKIEINDFDFITLSNQGRKKFLWALQCGIFLHDPAWIMQDSYNKLLKLPLTLRSKIGNLCVMNVGTKEMSITRFLTGDFIKQEIKPLVPEKYYAAVKHKKTVQKKQKNAQKLIARE